MGRFYADDVTMPNAARQESERRFLSGVVTMSANLLNQATNEQTGMVFSE